MLAAKAVHLVVANEFRACQIVVLFSACALFPAAFFLARELRFRFPEAYSAALLFVFFPTVWFYGATAFSDIPGVASSIAAAALLLAGCRDERAYLAGSVILGVAGGIRTQSLLFGVAPFLAAVWCHWRRRALRQAFGGGVIVAAIVSASYAGAALASRSISAYRVALQGVRDWVRDHDWFLAPERPPLSTLVDDYFLRPMAGNRLPIVVAAFALIALIAAAIRPRATVGLAVAIFLPFALFAWLMLDLNSVHRYATAYVFLWALLATRGAALVCAPLRRWRLRDLAQMLLIAVITGRAAYWTLPALRRVRRDPAPTYAAMEWVRTNTPAGRQMFVDGSLQPFADFFLYDRSVRVVSTVAQVWEHSPGPDEWYAAEGVEPASAVRFVWPQDRLWEIARHRYFSSSITRVSNLWLFGEGYYGVESDGRSTWQWLGPRARAELPAISGKARLQLTLVPAASDGTVVEVRVNGMLLERFACPPNGVTKSWVVDARSRGPNDLAVTTSSWVNPKARGISDDDRDLATELTAYAWTRAR